MKLNIGKVVANRTLDSTDAGRVRVPDAGKRVHLQFRRFAGCPFCSLHLRAFAQRHEELAAAGIREVIVFRSSAAELRRHHAELPFPVIPDPHDRLYAEFGVESALRAVLDPRAWGAAVRGVLSALPGLPGITLKGEAILGLPADFLIASDGHVLACKYGEHAYDQWSVDELLALVRRS